ncbi:hypothetical protein E0I56_005705 [Escherichia coli]|nr:hypothetical protein [Escherichia coli]
MNSSFEIRHWSDERSAGITSSEQQRIVPPGFMMNNRSMDAVTEDT